MRLEREKFFNPFVLTVNNVTHAVGSIIAFDNENGTIVAQNRCGWFGSNNAFHEGLELDCECVRKNKVDLKCKTAFVVIRKDTVFNDTTWILYIPASVLGVKEPKYEKYFKSMIRKTVETEISGVYFNEMFTVKSSLNDLNTKISNLAESIAYNSDTAKLISMVEELTATVKAREAEEKRLADTSIDELLEQCEVN